MLPSIEHLRTDFDLHGEDIPWETAITLAELSLLAYTEPHNRKLVMHLLDCDEVIILEDGSMSGFMAMKGDVAVVAFRGTDMYSPHDWLANIDFLDRTALDEGRQVHRSFNNAYLLFAEQIKATLAEYRPQYVWITGHSLGGAMATCCAYDFAANDIPFTGLVTFGQPRIGNRVMAQYLQDSLGERYLRFVNEGDVVPLVPAGIGVALPDYWHCGVRIRFNGGTLDRRDGLTHYSATGPIEATAATETTDDVGKDGEDTLTEEDLKTIQEYLQTTPPPEATTGLPAGLAGETQAEHTSEPSDPAPAAAMYVGDLIDSFRQRIGDHSMNEYLRQLNEFQQKGDSP